MTDAPADDHDDHDGPIRALARLAVRFGANVQPGQTVALNSQPGKEPIARALAEEAYAAGARFVELFVYDVYLTRSRLRHSDPDTLDYTPPWVGARIRALGEAHAARIALSGPVAPHALDGIDPSLIGRESYPRVPELMEVVNARTTNWCAVPGPTLDWATLVHPDLEPDAALDRLWSEIAHICRLDEEDPVGAWDDRLGQLRRAADELTTRRFDAIRLEGPGTDLTVGLLPSSRWVSASFETVDGIAHHANLPTEEVFTTPDPERVDGIVTATKPLFTSGTTVSGLTVRFAGGRVTHVDADEGAEVVRGLVARDDGSARLGELALVDREGRIGPLGTTFFDTLLDENAASHIALGGAYAAGVEDEADRARINRSGIHVDFMIGSDDVAVSGVATDGATIALLRGGAWQL